MVLRTGRRGGLHALDAVLCSLIHVCPGMPLCTSGLAGLVRPSHSGKTKG